MHISTNENAFIKGRAPVQPNKFLLLRTNSLVFFKRVKYIKPRRDTNVKVYMRYIDKSILLLFT